MCFFPKKSKFCRFWEILLFHSHSTKNLLQFDVKNFSNSKPDPSVKSVIINWRKCRTKTLPLSGWFSCHIINMKENISLPLQKNSVTGCQYFARKLPKCNFLQDFVRNLLSETSSIPDSQIFHLFHKVCLHAWMKHASFLRSLNYILLVG